MRSTEEIKKRIQKPESFLGFDADVLIEYLSFEEAAPLLKEEFVEKVREGKEKWTHTERTRESILSDMKKYMEFAWEKCLGHRGLSAGRSVDKFSAWVWLLGDEEIQADYAPYGAPILAEICGRYGFPVPDEDDARRMAKGLPCEDGCGECQS